MGIIYKLTFPDGKHYIGATRGTLDKRLSEHKSSAKTSNLHIAKAFLEFGKDSVISSEIAIINDHKELFRIEREEIIKHGSEYPNGYNGRIKRTEEQKNRMKELAHKRYEDHLNKYKDGNSFFSSFARAKLKMIAANKTI